MNHDVISIYDTNPGIADQQVLQKAVQEKRILITNDKDFGDMVIRKKKKHCGIILLRLEDERSSNKVAVLTSLFEKYSDDLSDAFVVVGESGVRIIKNK
jgi:predicted nuclease of predicted toxin-antitoxin system